jgi:hypothetical protein
MLRAVSEQDTCPAVQFLSNGPALHLNIPTALPLSISKIDTYSLPLSAAGLASFMPTFSKLTVRNFSKFCGDVR